MNARHAYLLAYDICDSGRWRRVHDIAQGHGTRLQYSVFRCELDRMELERLRNRLTEEIHHGEDRVMFFDLGPLDGLESRRTIFLGKPPSATSSSGPAIL